MQSHAVRVTYPFSLVTLWYFNLCKRFLKKFHKIFPGSNELKYYAEYKIQFCLEILSKSLQCIYYSHHDRLYYCV
jgi:hypothetical protein